MSIIDFNQQFSDEKRCLEYLEEMRWADGRYCPHCGSYETYRFKDGRLFKCADCRKQFTVKVGTIFSDSHVPLQKWFYAIFLNTSLKKGISSVQLAKYLGITQKSAWFMLQRIRYSLAHGTFDKQLEGTVEIDEVYIGGYNHWTKGTNFSNKTPIIGMVEQKENGKLRTKVLEKAHIPFMIPVIQENVKAGSEVHTDEYKAYGRLNQEYNHKTINHRQGIYAKDGVTTNTIEGAWSHLRLALKAIYMGVSPKHLDLYCNEFDYRYNTRELNDGQRFDQWFKFINGKRLTYKSLIR